MPTSYHIDNGPQIVIHSEDCFECFTSNTYVYVQNDTHAWERCTRCGFETNPTLLIGTES